MLLLLYTDFVVPTEYRLYTVVPRLVRFIDQLTNWYVRSNRKRIKVKIMSQRMNNYIYMYIYIYIYIHVLNER